MKSACLVLTALLGCQRGESTTGASPDKSAIAAPTGSAYAQDIAALCDSMKLSGADTVDEDARTLTVANWLGANLKTPESRNFLVQIQPLAGEPKATALDTEARRVGLSGCALATLWRTPAAP